MTIYLSSHSEAKSFEFSTALVHISHVHQSFSELVLSYTVVASNPVHDTVWQISVLS